MKSVHAFAPALLAIACGSSQPAPAAPSTVALAAASSEPAERPSEPPGRAPSTESDAGASSGEGGCAEYLEMRERCEQKLSAEIQTGNLLSAKSERARLEYLKKQAANPEEVEAACRQFQHELEPKCR